MKNNTFLIWYQTEDSSQLHAGGALLKERRDTRYRCGTEEEHLDNITQEFENSVQFIAKDYLSQHKKHQIKVAGKQRIFLNIQAN
jgi:hypothetical protein